MTCIFKTDTIRVAVDGDDGLEDNNLFIIAKATIRGNTESVVVFFKLDDDDHVLEVQSCDGCLSTTAAIQVSQYDDGGSAPVDYSADGCRKQSERSTVHIPSVEATTRAGPCGHMAFDVAFVVKENDLDLFLAQNRKKIRDDQNCKPSVTCGECGPACKYPSQMHLFRNGPFLEDNGTDFLIHVGDQIFYTHKSVMMVASSEFKRIIDALHQGQRGSVQVRDFEPQEVKMFLEVYYDRDKFQEYSRDCGKLSSMQRMAQKYGVKDILKRCAKAFSTVTIGPEHLGALIGDTGLCNAVPGLMDRCVREFGHLPENHLNQFPALVASNPDAYQAFFKQLAKVVRTE